MKTDPLDDSQLNQLLHEWKVESTLPPRFSEQVWRRIASEENAATGFLQGLRLSLSRLVSRPTVAFSYLVVLLVVGSAAGLWQAQAKSQRAEETLSARYVQMLDPYQMPRH